MNVHTLDPLTDERWPGLVQRHPGASVFHTREWLEALRRTYDYTPIAYSTRAPGEPLDNAVAFCHVDSWLTGTRLVSLPFADHCEPLVEHADDREAIAGELARAAHARRLRSIELRPLSPAEWTGASPGSAFAFHALDLDRPADDVFDGFHRDSIQRKVRRAEREGVVFDEGASDAHLRRFYALLVLTRRRHQVPPQPLAWFRNLMACFGSRLRICLAIKGGEAIAALVVLRHADTLVYKYGGSDARVHNVGAMPFLFWQIIQRAGAEGVRRLDLGRSDLDNAGLITFKDRLGARRTDLAYVRYRLPSRAGREMPWAARLGKRVMATIPDRLFVSSGRLLYRHFG